MVLLPPNKKKVYYLILFIFLKSFIAGIIGMEDILNMLADACVIYFASRIHSNNALRISLGKYTIAAVSTFFFVGILSDIINFTPFPTVLWGIRMFARYFLLLYVLISSFDITDIIWFKKLIYKLFLWNFLACLYQLYTFRIGDWMGGILHGNAELAIFLVFSSVFFCMEYFSRLLKWQSLLARLLICIFIAMWAEIKLLYFILPLCVYMCYVLARKTSFIHVAVLLLASVFFVPTMKYILSFYYSEEYIEKAFDEDNIVRETSHDGYNLAAQGMSFNRNTCIDKAQELLLHDPLHRSIGWGIGSGTNSDRFKTWIGYQYEQTAYFFFSSSYVLVETGWIGYICFLLVYMSLLCRFVKIFMQNKDPIAKYWTSIGIAMCIFTFIFIWYNDTPYSYYYIPFIIWGMCFVAIRGEEVQYNVIEEESDNDEKSIK